jgi:hypothetical protein
MCGTDIVFFSINATHSSNHDLHERLRLYSSYESLALDICSDKVSQNQSPANHNVAKAGNLCPELLYVRLMYCIARPLMAVQYLRTVIRRKVNVREVWSTTLRKHKIPMKAPEDLTKTSCRQSLLVRVLRLFILHACRLATSQSQPCISSAPCATMDEK